MDERRCAVIYLIIIYLFNRFHHGYNIMKRLGLNIHFDNITRTRDDSTGHTTEGGSKLSVPENFRNTNYVTFKTL